MKTPGAGPELFSIGARAVLIGVLLCAALAARLRHVADPLFDFHATRQYRSAIIARGYYRGAVHSLPAWRRDVAIAAMRRQVVLEPPVMECIAAAGYRVAGGEYLWIPRTFAALCWTIGGVFLYRLARRSTSADAAVFSLALYLFIPFGIGASTSFQPDSLMVGLSLAAIWAIVRCHDAPSPSRWALAAVVSAAAVFVKPMAVYGVLVVYFALAIDRHGVRGACARAGCWLFAPVVVSGAVLFAAHEALTGGVRHSLRDRVLPDLLLSGFFWNGCRQMIRQVIGWPYLAVALLGLRACVARKGAARALLAGLWCGYLAYCATFTWHIATHNYYHLPLIPLVALSAAGAADCLGGLRSSRGVRCGALCALLLIMLHGFRHSPATRTTEQQRREIVIAEEVGERVGHSTRTLLLASSYGFPLQYHGELVGESWPSRFDMRYDEARGVPPIGARERLRRMRAEHPADYFIVTNLAALDAQPDLKDLLARAYPAVAGGGDYVIADLRVNGGE